MGSEWKMNLEFNGWANGFYNGNENGYVNGKYNGNEFGKRFDYNEKTSLIFNNEHTKQSIK